jgi:predicted dithiol-disulfide oxidoreductase (DUF899 family)
MSSETLTSASQLARANPVRMPNETAEYRAVRTALLPEETELRRDGTIRHFWSGEMTGSTADPGQDPRGAPDAAPPWMVLDCTPEGRGKDWYPQLDYHVEMMP